MLMSRSGDWRGVTWVKKPRLGLDSGPPMERRERRDGCLHMSYRGHRQHQQPASDDKASADCARHEVPSDCLLREDEGRNDRH